MGELRSGGGVHRCVDVAERLARVHQRHLHVLDLFGGSGSTLMAAERMRRRAFLMEIDPLYSDVIVARYEAFTGKTAERVSA